jgi:hypothetical protein
MSVMQKPVEDGVCDGGVADPAMRDGHLGHELRETAVYRGTAEVFGVFLTSGAVINRRLARILISSAFVCALTACVTPETKPPQNAVLAKWASA